MSQSLTRACAQILAEGADGLAYTVITVSSEGRAKSHGKSMNPIRDWQGKNTENMVFQDTETKKFFVIKNGKLVGRSNQGLKDITEDRQHNDVLSGDEMKAIMAVLKRVIHPDKLVAAAKIVFNKIDSLALANPHPDKV
jgi:hypothetical protein